MPTTYFDAVVGWARAQLQLAGEPSGKRRTTAKAADKKLAELAASHPPMAKLLDRFALDPIERQLVELCWAIEGSLEVGRQARSLSGQHGLSLQLARTILGPETDRRLCADARLRLHGILAVDALPAGFVGATSCICLSFGISQRLMEEPFSAGDLALGVETLKDEGESLKLPEALALLVRDDLLDAKSRWVAIGQAQEGDAELIARALAKRTKRGVILGDGEILGRLPPGELWQLLAAVRREADLTDSPLIINGAPALGGLWKAIGCSPPAKRQLPTPVVLLSLSPAAAHAGRPAAGFAPREINFVAAQAPKPKADAEESPAANPAPSAAPADDGFEEIRRQAALDAARAMGRSLDISRLTPPAVTSITRAQAAPEVATKTESPAKPSPPSAPAKDEPPPSRSTGERKAEAGAAVPPAQAPASMVEAQQSASLAPAQAPAQPDPAESLPFVPVPEDAPIKDLMRFAAQAQNPLQRAELLRRMVSERPKDPQVAAILRSHIKSENPTVRQAAEDGMVVLFGPNWARTKSIPKPVQPPRSDDDRGPPGG